MLCVAAYGADDLSQANTVYLDSHWGLGASVRELVQGVDCPMTAAYLDAATFYKGSSKVNVHKNAICVFEHNPGECRVLRATTGMNPGRNFYQCCTSSIAQERPIAFVALL